LRVEQLRRAVIATRAEIATATTRAASTQSNSADMQPARADVLAPEQATAKKGIEKTNFYEALGLLRDADDDQIRDSYQQKKNAIESCPDSESSNKLKFITGAKNVLLNPATRALYDEKIGLRAIQPAMFQACANPNPAITVTPPHISKGFMEGFWERLRGEPWVSWILAIGILAAIAIPAYQDYTARALLADKTVSGAMSQPGDVIDGNPAMSRPGDVMDVQPAPAATFTYEEALAPGSDPLGLYQQPPAQPTLFEVTKKAAEGGNAVAQNKLASFYRDGRIVPKHVKAALYWFEKAASAGQENAQTSLGWAYMSNELELTPDYRLAMEWNRKAANQGFGEGSSNIGLLYESGWGMKVDYVEAANWYQKAIEQHARSGQAELQLGGLYENGFGVEKNIYKATTLYRTVVEKFGNGEFAEEAKARLEAISRDIKKPDGDGNNDWRDKKYGDKKSKRG
jgi:TPR repeat protein